MANIIINRTVNLDGPILPESMGAPLYQQENNAHQFVIQCKRGGNNLTLSGSVQGRMIRADGNTVVITGSVSDGKAVVTLPQSAYAVRGRFAFAVINVDSGATTVIYTATGNIGYTSTGQSIDPGTVVPDITLLLAQIDAMQQATAAANAAATGALANFAGAFVQATAYQAGTYVTYTDGFMYVLPDGHEADVTWANTTKTKVTTGKELSDLKGALFNQSWINSLDTVANNLNTTSFQALMKCIKNFSVEVYGSNTSAEIWNIQTLSDNTLKFSFGYTTPEGQYKSTSIILQPTSSSYSTVTLDATDYAALAFCTLTITYTTDFSNPITITSGDNKIKLNTQRAVINPITANYSNIDSRLIKSVVCPDNIVGVKINRIRNYGSSTYKYYAVYVVTFDDNTTKEYAKSNTTLLSGIYTETLDDVKITFDSSLLNYYANRLESNAVMILDATYFDYIHIKKVYHYHSDMVSDKTGLPPYKVFNDGGSTDDPSLFGQDNVRYLFDLPRYKKLHYFFEYQYTEPIPYYSSTSEYIYAGLATVKSGEFRAAEWAYAAFAGANYFTRDCYKGIGGPSISRVRTNSRHYNQMIGNPAFSVRTTLDPTVSANQDLVFRFEKANGKIYIRHSSSGTDVGSVTYSDMDSVDSLVSAINEISGIECKAIETSGHTCGELFFIGNGALPLVSYYSDPQKYDAHRLYIPYTLDTKWHTVEAVVDEDLNKGYVAIDGLTFETTLGTILTQKQLEIGGIIQATGSPITPIRIRNLLIDIDSWGDAEIVNSIAPPYEGKPQLISGKNPRLLIFEGHGIDIGSDADGVVSDDMAVSTDRLRIVMDKLYDKGYKPVSWNDIVDWKKGKISLPKRCYTMMFDDWRFENYINYEKRNPFILHNAKPGLAVITDEKSRSENVTIDGVQYSVGEVVDATMNNGWYPCSHTKNHRRLTDYTPSELDTLLKEDVISADKLGIYSDVLVYPYGANSNNTYVSLKNSDFAIGVSIVEDNYNCKANTDFFLTRVEIGIRETMENVLKPIV